jgi:membrane protease YdiL (CAAX protease family)
MTILGIRFEPKVTLVIIMGTLLPMIDLYDHTLFATKAYDRFVLYFLIPAAVISLVFREPLRAYGFRWGNWREGLIWTVAGCATMAIILWFVARTPAMVDYYRPRSSAGLLKALWEAAVDLFGWEFIWRGLMLFALARVTSPGVAIWLQAVPFAFAHLGKPEVETLSTIFGGAAFGFVAWRTQSFVYPFLIHTFITGWTIWVAMGGT